MYCTTSESTTGLSVKPPPPVPPRRRLVRRAMMVSFLSGHLVHRLGRQPLICFIAFLEVTTMLNLNAGTLKTVTIAPPPEGESPSVVRLTP